MDKGRAAPHTGLIAESLPAPGSGRQAIGTTCPDSSGCPSRPKKGLGDDTGMLKNHAVLRKASQVHRSN